MHESFLFESLNFGAIYRNSLMTSENSLFIFGNVLMKNYQAVSAKAEIQPIRHLLYIARFPGVSPEGDTPGKQHSALCRTIDGTMQTDPAYITPRKRNTSFRLATSISRITRPKPTYSATIMNRSEGVRRVIIS